MRGHSGAAPVPQRGVAETVISSPTERRRCSRGEGVLSGKEWNKASSSVLPVETTATLNLEIIVLPYFSLSYVNQGCNSTVIV